MSATGIDLAAPGRQHATIAGDVRALVLARLRGPAAALEPDDVVQDVYKRILRRNRLPCAYDPAKASVSKYIFQVASCSIADMLAAHRREQAGREDDAALDAIVDEPDEDALPWDPDAAPDEPDEREAFFLACCCLHVFGDLPAAEQLWQRALRQRREELAPGHQEALFELKESDGEFKDRCVSRLRSLAARPPGATGSGQGRFPW